MSGQGFPHEGSDSRWLQWFAPLLRWLSWDSNLEPPSLILSPFAGALLLTLFLPSMRGWLGASWWHCGLGLLLLALAGVKVYVPLWWLKRGDYPNLHWFFMIRTGYHYDATNRAYILGFAFKRTDHAALY